MTEEGRRKKIGNAHGFVRLDLCCDTLIRAVRGDFRVAFVGRAAMDQYPPTHDVHDPILADACECVDRGFCDSVEAQRRVGDFGDQLQVCWARVTVEVGGVRLDGYGGVRVRLIMFGIGITPNDWDVVGSEEVSRVVIASFRNGVPD